MKTQIIQLESYDDVTSIKDKMNWSQTSRILLVFPKRGKIIENKLDLMLLLRHSETLGCQIAMITENPALKAYATDLGIPLFKDIKSAQITTWRKPKFLLKKLEFRHNIQPEQKQENTKNLHEIYNTILENKKRYPEKKWHRLTIFSIGVLSILALVFTLLPKATIEITPPTISQSEVISIIANPNTKSLNLTGSVPAHWLTITVEGRSQIPATGSMIIPKEFAHGSVTFTNITDKKIVIPKDTIVSTSKKTPNIRFKTTKDAVVEKIDEKVQVQVRAVSAGSDGNVSAGEIDAIEGTLGLNLTVTNEKPTTGGASIRVTAPSKKDKDDLYQNLSAILQKNAQAELQKNSNLNKLKIITQTLTLQRDLQLEYVPEDNQTPSDILQLTLRQEYAVLSVNTDDLAKIALTNLDTNKPPGFSSTIDSLSITDKTTPILNKDGTITWEITAKRQLMRSIDANQVIKNILGIPLEQAKDKIVSMFALQEPPSIITYPRWIHRMPIIPFRISVVILDS